MVEIFASLDFLENSIRKGWAIFINSALFDYLPPEKFLIGVLIVVILFIIVFKLIPKLREAGREEDSQDEHVSNQPTPQQEETGLEVLPLDFTRISYYGIQQTSTGLWEEIDPSKGKILKGIYIYRRTPNPHEINQFKVLELNWGEKWFEFGRPKSPSSPGQLREFETQAGIDPPKTAKENSVNADQIKEYLSKHAGGKNTIEIKPQKLSSSEIRLESHIMETFPEFNSGYVMELSTDEQGNPHYYPNSSGQNFKKVFLLLAKYKDKDLNKKEGDVDLVFRLFEYFIDERILYVWKGEQVETEEEILEILKYFNPEEVEAKKKEVQKAQIKAQKAEKEAVRKEKKDQTAAKMKQAKQKAAVIIEQLKDILIKTSTKVLNFLRRKPKP